MPTKSQSQLFDIQLPNEDVLSLDQDAFQDLLNRVGVKFLHYRAIKCPVGLVDIFDGRRPHSDHSGCSNGFLYKLAGEMTCVFTSDKMQSKLIDLGLFNESSAVLTIPTVYDNSSLPVSIFNYDRLFVKDLNAKVVNTELVEANATGIDRLQYPALEVQDLIDANGKSYYVNLDFIVNSEGHVQWLSGKGPGVNLEDQRGRVYSVRYLYVPYWYIQLIFHEIRIIKGSNYITGAEELVRKPMSVLIQREYVFHNTDNANQRLTLNNSRTNVSPPSGGIFSPR